MVSRIDISKIEESNQSSKLSIIEISRYTGIKDRYIKDQGIKGSNFDDQSLEIHRHQGSRNQKSDRGIKVQSIKSEFQKIKVCSPVHIPGLIPYSQSIRYMVD